MLQKNERAWQASLDYNALFEAFCNYDLFQNGDALAVGNPFRRFIRPQDLNFMLKKPTLSRKDFVSNAGLMSQRILNVIYEQDLVFLPDDLYQTQLKNKMGNDQQKPETAPQFDENLRTDFHKFYDPHLKSLGSLLRPWLETQSFDWLNQEISVIGNYTPETMRDYLLSRLEHENAGDSALCNLIVNAKDPKNAAKMLLVQFAGDFATEASAMARNVLGNYGAPLSELFTILIDEYGYGLHERKHSTLFDKTLESVGMNSNIHHYWGHYLSSSLALTNYFHYISANHTLFYRYVGAMLYTEGTLHVSNRRQSKMLRSVFGKSVHTEYFDEHVHIDQHHAVMAMDRVIMPLVKQSGEFAIHEVIRGFEEFALLQSIADQDLMAQITWADQLAQNVEQINIADPRLVKGNPQSFHETPSEISQPHLHDDPELFAVVNNGLDFHASPFHHVKLEAGQAVHIPALRQHATIIGDQPCHYQTVTLKSEGQGKTDPAAPLVKTTISQSVS
ncbi:MAG: iron-containing redox enzyme family protein [Alphaproteobacteria bacterium]